jgi:ATP:corrinoid adenosyltransferase
METSKSRTRLMVIYAGVGKGKTKRALGLIPPDEFMHSPPPGRSSAGQEGERLRTDRPGHLPLAITGRNAAHERIDFASSVTKMMPINHPAGRGVRARTGIEI